MSDLKKCPFCGGKPEINDDDQPVIIKCTKCQVRVGWFWRRDTAITAWNKRAIIPAVAPGP